MSDFEIWWKNEGSAPPFPLYHRPIDWEAHCKAMCEIAWNNGAYKREEAKTERLSLGERMHWGGDD